MMKLRDVFSAIGADCQRYQATSDPTRKIGALRYVVLVLRPSLLAMALYRFSHWYHARGWKGLAEWLYRLNLLLTGADIYPASRIAPGCLIVHTVGTVIHATLGKNATLFAHVVIQPEQQTDDESLWPCLGDDVHLGSNTSVIGAVRIADRVKIAPFGLVQAPVEHADSVICAPPGKDRIVIRKDA